jgi:hypothetical protein
VNNSEGMEVYKDVIIDGRFLKTAQLRDEYYVPLSDPAIVLSELARFHGSADVFTFVQELHETKPKFPFHREFDRMAVLPLTTYDAWFNKQINFKPRNKIKKALKSGIEVEVVPFSDNLVHGIRAIYNESPLRQGKRNWHYQKDFETVKREHATFLDRSEFISVRFKGELIGFAKVTHSQNYSILMNIVAKIAHRDKAPTNALIDKTVKLCTDRGIPLLNYGVWGRRGLNDFKVASGFTCLEVPRYFIPLTLKGRLALKLKLHRELKNYLPESWILFAAEARRRWNEKKFRTQFTTVPNQATPAETAVKS